jgi:hypothetical protein
MRKSERKTNNLEGDLFVSENETRVLSGFLCSVRRSPVWDQKRRRIVFCLDIMPYLPLWACCFLRLKSPEFVMGRT